MERTMEMPKYYDLVRLVAQIGAVLGCLSGAFAILTGLSAFNYGVAMGFTAIFGGLVTIVLSLAGLGITYCFLAMVKAQIESRNAIIQYTTQADQS